MINKVFAGGLCTAALVSGAIALAPLASADNASYIYDLEQSGYGFYGNKGNYVWWGQAVCNDEVTGKYSRDQIIRNVVNGNSGLTVDGAVFIVEAAEIHLC